MWGSCCVREVLGKTRLGSLRCCFRSLRGHLFLCPLTHFFLPFLGDQEVLGDFLLLELCEAALIRLESSRRCVLEST